MSFGRNDCEKQMIEMAARIFKRSKWALENSSSRINCEKISNGRSGCENCKKVEVAEGPGPQSPPPDILQLCLKGVEGEISCDVDFLGSHVSLVPMVVEIILEVLVRKMIRIVRLDIPITEYEN